eukprot:216610-Prymnesium_polylepis.1
MLGKEGVGNSDGEGNGILPRQTRSGTLPVDGDRVGQQRVVDQRSVIEGRGDVVGKAGAAGFLIGEGASQA